MKKLFSFRSHSSNSNNNNEFSQTSTDKQVSWEKTTNKVDKFVKTKHGSEDPVFGTTPCLRRSLSFSSGSLCESGKGLRDYGNQTGSPISVSYYSDKQSGHPSSCSRPPTPERQTSSKCNHTATIRNAHGLENFDSIVSRPNSDSSDTSHYGSSNVSSKVLDRYIDGEQEIEERCESRPNFSMKNQFDSGNDVAKRPPRLRFTAVGGVKKQKPKTSSKDGGDSEYGDESPRKLAKHVIERLSQSHFRSKELDHRDIPISIDDVYGRAFNRCSSAYSEEISEFSEKDSEKIDDVIDTDIELFKKFKEAKNRAAILSEEFVEGDFLRYRGLSVPASLQTIKNLTEENVNMALEVSDVLEDRIAENALFREKLELGRVDKDARIRRLEREKNELQLTLEKELDRRSNEWSLKLEKLQAEEHRLRERVRELAEQNVCLQRDASFSSEMEIDARTKITLSEKQLGDSSVRLKEAMEENRDLRRALSEIEEKARAAEEERDIIRRNYEEKVIECKDMHKSISRLHITCNDQEKTIDGLRNLCDALGKKMSGEQFDFGSAKVQAEHMRLTGVEHTLRKKVESYRAEVETLRRENIDLLRRLKIDSEEGGVSTFQLDRELESRVSCLQDKILPLLTESSRLGRKLIEFVKINGRASAKCLDGHALVECEVKLQSLERAAENITNSMRTVSCVVREKSLLCRDGESHEWNEQKSEDIMKSALKAETLLSSLLREKLLSKQLDLERLQAELAAAVRGNDVLKCDLQNAVDSFSCVNHKMKELELQTMKKDETIDKLERDLQEYRKETGIMRGILTKVSDERDAMWEEVKQYSENNMLMNSEINVLRNKIEALDEDILLKEGQITILKDSIAKPFDLLASPDAFC